MAAGVPNYQRLAQIGKLPPEHADKVPSALVVHGLQERIKLMGEQMCDDCKAKILDETPKEETPKKELNTIASSTGKKCLVEGCDYTAQGSEAQVANRLRLHAKSHEGKQTIPA